MSLFRADWSAPCCDGGTLADLGAPPSNDRTDPRPRDLAPSVSSQDFDALYAEWYGGVVRWATAMGVRNSDKFDVAQNVFLVVQRRLRDFDQRNIAGWLYTITARQVKDHQMQVWNRSFFKHGEQISDDLPSSLPTPAMWLESQEQREVLEGLLDQLSEAMRTAMVLFDLHGFSCDEIAAMQGVSPNTIWTRLRRARRKVVQLVARRGARAEARVRTTRWRSAAHRAGHA